MDQENVATANDPFLERSSKIVTDSEILCVIDKTIYIRQSVILKRQERAQ